MASLYAARWDIENFFREAKSENLLGRLKSKNDAITEIFIRIPIIRLIISRELFGLAHRILDTSMVIRLKKGHGQSCLQKMQGEFSAIWPEKSRVFE